MNIKKIKKQLPYLYIGLIAIVIGMFIVYKITATATQGVGGSGDWITQHVVFIDLIRNNFWETGNIFPDFTMLLGGGINYADLAYYGTSRPEVLLSFLFPRVSTYDWVIASHFILYVISAMLCYKWINTKTNSMFVSLVSSIIYMLIPVLSIHVFMHLMFINYLPWLFLLLIAIDKYNDNYNYKYLIILSTLLLILSSYYFAVSSLILVGLYTLLGYKQGSRTVFNKISYMLIGVLVSCFFLVPTLLESFVNSRDSLQTPVSLKQLLVPSFSMRNLLIYNSVESPGLTFIAIVSIIFNLLSKNKTIRNVGILVFIVASFKIFMYIFSGFDYFQTKTLIPLIPLVILNIGYFIKHLSEDRNRLIITLIISLLICVCFYSKHDNFNLILLDLFVIIVISVIALLLKTNKSILLYLCMSVIVFNQIMDNELLPITMGKEFVSDTFNNQKKELANQVLTNNPNYRLDNQLGINNYLTRNSYSPNIYSSVLNKEYVNFLRNEINIAGGLNHIVNINSDPIANYLLGIRYIETNKQIADDLLGYHEVANVDNNKIYESKDVLPIAYISYDNVSFNEYDSLSANEKIDVLTNYGVVADGNITYTSHLVDNNISYSVVDKTDNITFSNLDNGNIKVNALEDTTIKVKLNNPIINQLLLINFDIENVKDGKNKEVGITINGYTNVKIADDSPYNNKDSSFGYHLGNKDGLDTLQITFEAGEYEIANVQTDIINYENLIQRIDNITAVNINRINDNKTVLSGNVDVKEDGYLITSIPYQKGFKIYVDGQEKPVEKVNAGFIGCKVEPGTHEIVIKYSMPGKQVGVMLSTIGLISIVGIIVYDYRKNSSTK